MFGFISRNILTGLITILPIVLTVYLLYWLGVTTETFLGGLIKSVVPESFYWPGMGILVGLAGLFAIGVLMHAYVVRVLFKKIEQLILHLPFVKPVYRAIRDFFDYFKPHEESEYSQVVSITLPGSRSESGTGMKVIGFVTQPIADDLPDGFNDSESILVYLPLSYMIGGYTLLVPRNDVTAVDMSMEEAMRFTLTAGVAMRERSQKQASNPSSSKSDTQSKGSSKTTAPTA